MRYTVGNMQKYAQYAAQAFYSFMTKKADLNTSIADIAWENDLSLNDIKRVSETANQLVQEKLLKTASNEGKDKTFTFKLADFNKVAGIIKSKGREVKDSHTKTASGISHFGLISRVNVFGKVMAKTASTPAPQFSSPEHQEKYASEVCTELEDFTGQIQQIIDDLKSQEQGYYFSMAKYANDLRDEIERTLFNENADFTYLFKAACEAYPDNKDFFSTVFTLVRNDLIKEASPVAEKLLPINVKKVDHRGIELANQPILILNGDHKMFTIYDSLNGAHQGWGSVRDHQANLHQAKDAIIKEIRDLSTTHNVSNYLDGKYRKQIKALIDKYKNFDESIDYRFKPKDRADSVSVNSTPIIRPRARRKTSTKKAGLSKDAEMAPGGGGGATSATTPNNMPGGNTVKSTEQSSFIKDIGDKIKGMTWNNGKLTVPGKDGVGSTYDIGGLLNSASTIGKTSLDTFARLGTLKNKVNEHGALAMNAVRHAAERVKETSPSMADMTRTNLIQ